MKSTFALRRSQHAHRVSRLSGLLCLVLCCLAHVRLGAAIWYLDQAAAGANNGTSPADAWNSVASVEMKAIQSGDTLLIQGGDYSTEELSLVPAAHRTNIAFRINPTATRKAVFRSISLYGAHHCTIDGLLPGTDAHHYTTSIQMFKTVGLNTVHAGLRTLHANSVLIRESDGAVVRGVECDQSALKVYVDDGGMQQHGIAINGDVDHLILEYNYIHDTIGDGINLI